jgi:PAS domain S-box-containing protein
MSELPSFEDPADPAQAAQERAACLEPGPYRDLFLASPTPIVLLDCTTLQVADLNDQARSLFALSCDARLPGIQELLSFDDPAALAACCARPGDAWTELAATRRNAPAGKPFALRLKRLPAPYAHLAQVLCAAAPAGPCPDPCDGVYASIFSHAGIGLTVIDTSMRVLSMNPTIRAWFPQIDPESRPYCYASFNAPPRDTVCSYCPAIKVLQDGKPHHATTSTPTPDGMRHYSMIATPVFDAQGRITSVIETAEDVTDRLRLEQQMAEKSRNLQAVLDNAPIAIWYKDLAGRFRFVNRTFCRQMGIPEEEFLAAPHFSQLLPAEMASTCSASDRHCLTHQGKHVSLERFPFSDGTRHLLSVTKAQLQGEDGEPIGVIGLGIDITEQQLYAERLKLLTDSFLRFGPDFDANINVLTEVAGRIMGADCALFNLLEAGLLCSVGQWQSPESYPASDRPQGHLCYDLMQSGSSRVWLVRDLPTTPYAVSDPNVLRFGLKTYLGVPVVWGERTLGVLCTLFTEDRDPSPSDLSFLQIVAAALGIEESRRRSVLAQKSSERRYRALFSEAGEGVFLMSEQGVIQEVNQVFAGMHGYRPEEMAGMHLSSLDTPETLALVPDRMMRLMRGEHITFEVEHFHRDGHRFLLEVSASAIDCEGRQNIICFHRDITERKLQEEALRKSEREFRLLADAMPQMVWICGADGKNLYTNDKWVTYTGITGEASCDAGWEQVFHPEDLPRAWEAWNRAAQGWGEYSLEARLKSARGEFRWWLVRGVPERDEAGRVLKWFGTCTDIDDLKRAEEERRVLEKQFQQAQKLESLGVLAGGVAHDFNNILAIISGYCSLLSYEPERCPEYLPEIANAADRAAELCRQMLAYAGKTQSAMGLVDLGTLVSEMVRMLRATLGQNVVIDCETALELCHLLGDAGQIRQVLMNLIINASEAIGEAQGEVRLALDRSEICPGDGECDHLGKEIPPGAYACLEVSDNGCGMDEETRTRIFEPFFSTKFSGRGLGMSAVLGIISAHGGALQLYSSPGAGTRFRIYFPTLEGAAAGTSAATAAACPVPWQGTGTVLLVEDEPMVRLLACTMLQKLGFQVVEAGNGREGLERYRQHRETIRFVVTDLGMPLMDGYQMLGELKELDPALPVVITTGFGDVDVTSRIPRDQIAAFVGKPYSFPQMREVLRRVTARADHPNYQQGAR